VYLQHATPRRNRPSIDELGLLTSRSRGKLKVVWLHSPGNTLWAVEHVAARHRVGEEAVVVLRVSVPRSALRRHRRGLWYSVRDIPPGKITRVREI
jgi:hypothetical protein